MKTTLTYDELVALKPCASDFEKVEKMLGDATSWNGMKIDAAQAVDGGVTLAQLVWVASAVAMNDADVEKRLRHWLADVATRVLRIFEKERPTDFRPRNAIIVARAAAGAAAGDAAGAAAGAAARAATWAAARAAAGAAARAAARAAEEKWQLGRLVEWLSDTPPEPLPLPDLIIAQKSDAA